MHILAAIASFIYAIVNSFGAWAVVRRKPWLAAVFMIAASILVIAGVSVLYRLPFALAILGGGLILASVASFLNAHIMLGNVVWRFHVLRASIATAIYLLAYFGLT